MYPPLRHAEWHGWTAADFIFPFFLFIVGVSVSLALSGRLEQKVDVRTIYIKIGKRSVILFALGLFLALFPSFDFAQLRIPGVLQRIAVCYLVSSVLFLRTGVKGRLASILFLLGGYWAILKFIPVPGYGPGTLELEGNLCGYIDNMIFGSHLYKSGFDPEGILSTLPAIATTLTGVLMGDWMRSSAHAARKFIVLLLSGTLLVFFGLILHPLFPINKQLWTSTYVLFTSGAALILFGICYGVLDVLKMKKWSIPFVILGMNAITVYVGSGILVRLLGLVKISEGNNHIPLKTFIFKHLLAPWAGPFNGSLIYPMLILLVCWGILFFLYKKNIFIKI